MIRLVRALLLLLAASSANADQLRPGYLEFTQTGAADWRLIWKAPLTGGIAPEARPVLPQGCASVATVRRELTPIATVTETQVRCAGSIVGKPIGVAAMDGAQTDILVRVAPLGVAPQALRITAAQPSVLIAAQPSRAQVAQTYFVIGIEHIVFGFDHLLFVAALVILLQLLRPIVWAVTAFTVSHSITLVATTIGLIGLPSRPVEAVIALSIVFLAVEIAKRVPGQPRLSERIPWAVAFAFGLLHGFGFAGALAEIGLPATDVPLALLAFNLGVEAGQLAIVAVSISLIHVTRMAAASHAPRIERIASYAIGSLASAWLIERLIA